MKLRIAALALALGLGACVTDYDDNPPGPRGGPGTNWENPPGPTGGPGASPDYRNFRSWRHAYYNGRYYYLHPRRNCWYLPDRDDNPPGPVGGPGTNWENPPGAPGGPGATPDRHRCR